MKSRKELIVIIQKLFKDNNYSERIYNDTKYPKFQNKELKNLTEEESLIRELFDRIAWDEREIETVKRNINVIMKFLG